MTENNRHFRIRTNVNEDNMINVNINQDYDILEILSLKISTENLYKLHSSNYGCVVGRVLANGGVGIPNAKISIFISSENIENENEIIPYIYPYKDVHEKNNDGIRYNLLPNEQTTQCHQQVGTFPNKRLVLDDNNILEVFDKYYKFTTVSNSAGDYMLFGVPIGEQTIHMDLDLSDIGMLSQKPIDLTYKGYNITQFESASRFKKDNNLDTLTQIISQDKTINVYSFWGDSDEGEIKITRNDIDVDYKFEPTCIFIGSIISDDKSNAFSKKCVPTVDMGRMDKLTTGSGTIEMIRKKSDGTVEEYSIQGNELINGNGTWCYQIPMNLDYVTTDEYGNLVPTDNPERGIATRARVRFRISLSDFDSDYMNNHLTKILVPHNPKNIEDIDYVFGTDTKDKDDGTGSFRDLFWNNVYTVKSYIPRIQKGNNQRTNKFSGFKNVNVYGKNNPIPYNNMRVNITFMFVLQCAIMKCLIFFCKVYNWAMRKLPGLGSWKKKHRRCAYIGDGLCPDLEGWYFAPGCNRGDQRKNTFDDIKNKEGYDTESNDYTNKENETICLTNSITYFMQCLEINLAMENEVIKFDFYNDWINGLVYIPRWFVNIRKKRSYLFGLIKIKPKVQACLDSTFTNSRRLTQQCSLIYNSSESNSYIYDRTVSKLGCKSNSKQKCHKTSGRDYIRIFKGNPGGGIVHDEKTYKGQSVYYPRPTEWIGNKKCNLFATDIVLLGNINSCNQYGIPKEMGNIGSSTYQMPQNMPQTNMDSDGVLYGIGGKQICSNKPITSSVEPIQQTFRDYITWSKGQEFYEINPDDVDEYAVLEMSGIDWGIDGPSPTSVNGERKEKNLSSLYFPGGHFLGIACTNAQVNIKSCVNLSRICEINTLMSQRQYKIVRDYENNSYKYAYIVPSGLISKDEIGDNSYKNIFSTLNHNRLKTIIDENGMRKYEFISMNPINFNGVLHDKVFENNGYYNDVGLEGNDMATSAITRTFEDNSKDYYDFRMGIITDEDKKNIENKFLIRRSGGYGMPVYENSFYFYFGKQDGSTAMDRFLSDYYSTCYEERKHEEPNAIVELGEYIACSENKGAVKITVKNVPLPYSYAIYKDNKKLGEGFENEFYFNNVIEYNKLDEGNYFISIKNELQGVDIEKDFIIRAELPNSDTNSNLTKGSIETSSVNFSKTPVILMDEINHTYSIHNSYYGGFIEIKHPKLDTSKDGPYLSGIIIACDGYYGVYEIFGNPASASRDIFGKDSGYVRLNLKQSISDDKTSVKITGWSENSSYQLYAIYACDYKNYPMDNNSKFYKIIELPTEYIGVIDNEYDYYIYDESVRIKELEAKGALLKDSVRSYNGVEKLEYKDEEGNMVTDGLQSYFEPNVSALTKFIDTDLTDVEIWKLKKSIMFSGSLFEYNTHSITVGTIGTEGKVVENIYGFGEMLPDEESFVTVSKYYYKNEKAAERDGYVLDLQEIAIPNQPWRKKTLKEEVNWKSSTVLINNEKKPYYYKAFDNGKYLAFEFNTNKNYYDKLRLNIFYRPFIYNAILVLAPSDTFKICRTKASEVYGVMDRYDQHFKPIYNDIVEGNKSTVYSGDSTKCYGMFYYTISNGCSMKYNNVYNIGDVHLNVNFDIDIIKNGGNYRINDELNEYSKNSTFDSRYDIRSNGYIAKYDNNEHDDNKYSTEFGFGGASDGYKSHLIDAQNYVNVSFEVNEASVSTECIGDAIANYYNGIRFYDTIGVGDGSNQYDENGNLIVDEDGNAKYNSNLNHYVTTGYSSKGVRYYFVNHNDFKSFIMSCANINTSYSLGNDYEAGWQSIWTRQNNNKSRIFNNEITDRLRSANLWDYSVENYEGKNSGLNPNLRSNADLVIGIYDEYTQLDGDYWDGESDYSAEIANFGGSIPFDIPRLSVVKIYRILANERNTYDNSDYWKDL